MAVANFNLINLLLRLFGFVPLILIVLVLVIVNNKRHGPARVFAERFNLAMLVYIPLFLLSRAMPTLFNYGLFRNVAAFNIGILLGGFGVLTTIVWWGGLLWAVMGLPTYHSEQRG